MGRVEGRLCAGLARAAFVGQCCEDSFLRPTHAAAYHQVRQTALFDGQVDDSAILEHVDHGRPASPQIGPSIFL